jgi:hypothetical protein
LYNFLRYRPLGATMKFFSVVLTHLPFNYFLNLALISSSGFPRRLIPGCLTIFSLRGLHPADSIMMLRCSPLSVILAGGGEAHKWLKGG